MAQNSPGHGPLAGHVYCILPSSQGHTQVDSVSSHPNSWWLSQTCWLHPNVDSLKSYTILMSCRFRWYSCFFASVCVNSPLMHSWTHPAKRWGERSPPLVAPGVPGRSLKNSVTVSPIKNVKKKSHLLGYNINNDLFNGMRMYYYVLMYVHTYV